LFIKLEKNEYKRVHRIARYVEIRMTAMRHRHQCSI